MDQIFDSDPRIVEASVDFASAAQVERHHRNIEVANPVPDGRGASEGYDDQGVCHIDGDKTGTISKTNAVDVSMQDRRLVRETDSRNSTREVAPAACTRGQFPSTAGYDSV